MFSAGLKRFYSSTIIFRFQLLPLSTLPRKLTEFMLYCYRQKSCNHCSISDGPRTGLAILGVSHAALSCTPLFTDPKLVSEKQWSDIWPPWSKSFWHIFETKSYENARTDRDQFSQAFSSGQLGESTLKRFSSQLGPLQVTTVWFLLDFFMVFLSDLYIYRMFYHSLGVRHILGTQTLRMSPIHLSVTCTWVNFINIKLWCKLNAGKLWGYF